MIKFLKKYEFWVLIILAIAMYLSESLFGIDGLHDVGTVFFFNSNYFSVNEKIYEQK
jgi:hypothetical protein